jgi:DNA (cytosine-5)-methyltransferase 1
MRTQEEISSIMAKVKSSNTHPEMLLKQALDERGIVYLDSNDNIPGKPDVVLPEYHIAIFVDGDYWHGNQWKLRGLPSLDDQFKNPENKTYWVHKIERNVIRDSKVSYELMDHDWIVIRLWESQIENDLNGCIDTILNQVRGRLSNPMVARAIEKSFTEFFAGIGLMRIGLETKGWKCSFSNDFDPEKIKMYQGQFQADSIGVSNTDIHKLPVDTVPTVSLATASFPCNDLSLAGSRMGLNEGKQSSAFWGFIRVLEELGDRKPPFVLLENVVGFLSSKNGEDFKQALMTLNELGYQTDTFILDAANFVPQSRKRMFIIGVHQDLRYESTPDIMQIIESNSRPKAIIDFIYTHPEINWRIRPLPNQPVLKIRLDDILEDLPSDSLLWWSNERAEYLLNQMSAKHREMADRMIAGEKWSYGTVFRRVRYGKSMAELRTDGIAGCLRTPRGGSGRQILIKAGFGKFQVRLLSPRECARLMGADDYQITVGNNQALFGFGDAVCVPVIEWIADYYLNPLLNEVLHEFPLAKYGSEGENRELIDPEGI